MSTANNRIKKVFENKKDILNVYFTAGFPALDDTVKIIELLSESGADILEIGMPFSDPLADGPTIQQSSEVAIKNGMTIEMLFSQLKDIRQKTQIPILLMGYMNPVLQYGVEKFIEKCAEVGIDGLILPDLPMHEYMEVYKPLLDQHGLVNTFLVTPQTSEKRIKEIDNNTEGFIYLVSSAGTTGAKEDISNQQEVYFKRIQEMKLKNPQLIGFGISSHETFTTAASYTSGAIIGSAFIKVLNNSNDLETDVPNFVKNIKQG